MYRPMPAVSNTIPTTMSILYPRKACMTSPLAIPPSASVTVNGRTRAPDFKGSASRALWKYRGR